MNRSYLFAPIFGEFVCDVFELAIEWSRHRDMGGVCDVVIVWPFCVFLCLCVRGN